MLLKFPRIPATLRGEPQATGIGTRLALRREYGGRGARLWRSKPWHFAQGRADSLYDYDTDTMHKAPCLEGRRLFWAFCRLCSVRLGLQVALAPAISLSGYFGAVLSQILDSNPTRL